MLLLTLWAVVGGQGSLWGARGADGRSRPRLKGGRRYVGLGGYPDRQRNSDEFARKMDPHVSTSPSQGPPRVLCYGDSLTAGYTALTKYTGAFAPWAPHLADALGITVHHVGMCGWKVTQMLDGLDGEANVDVSNVRHRGLRRLLKEGGYTHVLLMVGSNDLKLHSASEIVENLKQLHAVCHVAGARTLALGIPHSKASTVGSRGRCENRHEMNEKLCAFAADNHSWCGYCEPGKEVQQWEAGSPHFEQDGLHLTRTGYATFAMLLLRGGMLREFLSKHEAFVPRLPKIDDDVASWRRRMREWMEQHRVAVDAVQDDVFDVQMAKASREELEGLHGVLQNEGIAGLQAAIKALELKSLYRALMEGGLPALHEAEKAAEKAKRAAARARFRGGMAPDIAKLAQTAFVPMAGMDLQEAAQRLHVDPSTLCARLDEWRSSDADREPWGDIESKDAIECFVDSFFTVCTFDDVTYHPLPAGTGARESMRPRDSLREGESEAESEAEGEVESDEEGGDEGGDVSGDENEGESEGAACTPGRWSSWGGVSVPWLPRPSPQLTSFTVVHRGPLAGGHLKLYLRGGAGGGAEGGAIYQVDVMKEASKLQAHHWGAATPLACAAFAYPRSGSMYPTIFRFVQVR